MLVDLASTRALAGLNTLNPNIVGARLDNLIFRLSESIVINSIPNEEFRFRFYDGWRDELGHATQIRSLVNLHLKNAYSTRRRIAGKVIRIFAELAEGPINNPELIFPWTIRISSGLPSFTLLFSDLPPASCFRTECTLTSVKYWLRTGRCPDHPGCKILLSDFIKYRHQKLVDCHIASDLLILAYQGENVSLTSMDTDFIPPLITAGKIMKKIFWICTGNNLLPENYKNLIKDFNVEVLVC